MSRCLLLLFCLSVCSIYAQEDAPIESDWSGYLPSVYSRGDQTFNINLGIVFPLVFAAKKTGVLDKKIEMGGMGVLGYNYFFGAHLFLGGDVSGAFFGTEAKNNYFIVPMGMRIGYQLILNRFEFPLSMMVGFAPQQYLSASYFGLFVKPGAGVFFRFNPEWSFGINTGLWWVPQWTGKKRADYSGNVNVHGLFLETTIGVRYHF